MTAFRHGVRPAWAGILGLALWLWLGAGPATAASFRVGSFTKSTAPPTAVQVVPHGLGETPKALILWTVGKTSEALGGGLRAGFGFTDNQGAAADSHSQGWSINDGVTPSNADTHSSTAIDPELVLVIQSPAGPVATADFGGWNATDFTLNWLTNDGNPYVIHFIAIGGAEVRADMVATQLRSSPGNYTIGVGFRPDVVFLLPTQTDNTGVNTGDAVPSLGVLDRYGNQWALAGWSDDAQATSNTLRAQATNAAVLNFAADGTVSHRASLQSFYDMGFTLNYSVGTQACGVSPTNCRLFVLAVAGIEAFAGSFNKATLAGPQTVTGVRKMKPRTVMLASFQDVAQAGPVDHHRIGIGASDGTTEGSSAWQDTDNLNPSSADSIDKTSKVFVKVNNNTPAIDAEADLTGFGWERFTLDWTTNDAVPTQMLYLALGEDITQYRSIGTALAYGAAAGTVGVTQASRSVTGTGTAWRTNNRGRGDVVTIPCGDPPTCTGGAHYAIDLANTDTSLTLVAPYAGSTTSGLTYLIRRQHTTLQLWEDCISFGNDGGAGPGADSCSYFDAASVSLVADDRREVGVAYRDTLFTAGVRINGTSSTSNTDADHTITLTAPQNNRHQGVAWDGAGNPPHAVIDHGTGIGVDITDNYVTVEYLETRTSGGGTGAHAIAIGSLTPTNQIVVRNNLLHASFGAGTTGNGIWIWDGDTIADLYNNVVYEMRVGMLIDAALTGASQIRIINNTVYSCNRLWSEGSGIIADDAFGTFPTVILLNNISATNVCDTGPGTLCDFNVAGLSVTSSNNLSTDATATAASPGGSGLATQDIDGDVQFVNRAAGLENLHISPFSIARNNALDLSFLFQFDIDLGVRPSGAFSWDIGADEQGTTAVKLMSFAALPGDASVLLQWRTGSELSNLGFHVYRAASENGPWTRLTSSLIPGLGSSAVGQGYSFRDAGLVNGTRYFFRLDDVDASSKTTSHGPVSAVPMAGVSTSGATDGRDGGRGSQKKDAASSSCPDWVVAASASAVGSDAATTTPRCTRHGDPEAVSLGVLSRDSRQVTLELRTGGFYALHTQSSEGEPSGSVRVFVPGFDFPQDEQAAALPIRRALTDAAVGRRVELAGVRALDLVSFKDLVPASLGKAEMQVGQDGTVRAARRAAARATRHFHRSELVRLLPSLFQGETKSAVVEIAPLRFDARRGLVLARRVLVRLRFTGREAGESGRGSLGRAPAPWKPASAEVLARLFTTSRGLHALSFEQLLGERARGLAASQLSLERQGEPVAFHLEPSADRFGPGSRLFFYADSVASSTAFSGEVSYELVRSRHGRQMPLVSVVPAGNAITSASTGTASFETNRFYQPGLLEAQDLWHWEVLASGATRVKSFSLAFASPSGAAELDVFLQGASESGAAVDHHVSVSLNGLLVGDARFAGRKPYRISLSLPASLLRQGANELVLTNVADTGVTSFVFLDRFSLGYPQSATMSAGLFEGTWTENGTATVLGASGPLAVLDVTATADVDPGTPSSRATIGSARWLTGYDAAGSFLRLQVASGHRYLVVAAEGLQSPRVALPQASTLRSGENQADYVLVAAAAFLPAAEPLLARRADEGLTTRAVSLEEIADGFGHGQTSADAIKSFLAFAFHSWARPSPRYVLLLGDASYDPRNFTGSSLPSPLPALWARTSYLWTASDPQLAAVNGDDNIPDLAIGRLPASTVEQAQALVEKLLAWEDSGQGLSGPATLVADNPDLAGDFEQDVEDIHSSYLASRETRVLKLSELGASTRPSILEALNSGLSFLNYVGHGGAAVWASENVWNSWDASSLLAQSRQPLLVTMNCLNGYFVAPAFESLAESLVKAEGRGAIAAFSPSGLSLDGPAHQYHRALMAELVSGSHERLGDAVLAAQGVYAQAGLMPELLSVYHLFGDPAMRTR